ncbi:MAG TPA: CsbD family protein [Solirubrobacterales bacterium]|nr:CsbD family protein [Solirubrobacterales bacterium]
MSDEIRNKDDAKGRVKEAAGSLTGDDDLKREGKVDKASGAVKGGLDKASDKVKDAVGKDRDRD